MARSLPASLLLVAALAALGAAPAACGDNGAAPGPHELVISPERLALRAGDTARVEATYHATFAAPLAAADVTWSSSDPARATVRGDGAAATITAIAPGDVAITAAGRGLAATLAVAIAPAPPALQSIAIAPGAPDVPVGADRPFVAIGTFADSSTADLTEQVTWSSSNPLVATISNAAGARGLADAVGAGTTTIAASLGAVAGAAQLTVFLAPVGPWAAEPGAAAVQACADGVKFSTASDLVYVCTTAAGVLKGTVTGTAIAWSSANTGITNLQGQGLVAHTTAVSTLMYLGAPQAGVANWFRSTDGAATFGAFTLLDSAGSPRALYTGRFQPMIGNMVGSWDPGGGAPQAVILTGTNPPAAVRVLPASGTVRAIAGSTATNLYAAVLGETPAGATATGGVFRSTNTAITWTAHDSGIPAADKDRVFALVMDPVDPAILYAGLQGGGRVYKTIDGGATWTPSAAGLPAKARVSQLLISPHAAATIFAATQIGLYRSDDAGATWALAGFQGRRIRGVAQSSAAAALILVAVDDEVGLYRAL